MKNRSQAGFTLIEGLLIVIAVTLIAGVGFYIMKANQPDLTSPSDKPLSSHGAKSKTAQTSTLDIKEFGLKLDSSSLKTAYYKLAPGDDTTFSPSDFPEVKFAYLYDRGYDEIVNNDGKKCSDYDNRIVGVEFIEKTVRDQKYSKYRDTEIGPADPIPNVLSDKGTKEKNGYLYFTYNVQVMQAAPACTGQLKTNISTAKAAKNEEILKQYKAKANFLETMVGTLQKD